MDGTCLLGIDVGTTMVKSALFTETGERLGLERAPCPLSHPRDGWAEQAPDDWWRLVAETVRAVTERVPGRRVKSLALSTQGGCLCPLDGDFSPLAPAVSWLDRRAAEVTDIVSEAIPPEELYRTCGWGTTTGLGMPLVVWFREKRPGLFRRTRYFASTADYLAARLTGRFAIDYSNCAMTLFFRMDPPGLSERAAGAAGIERGMLPECLPSGVPLGTLTPRAAGELGLDPETLVVTGAHDQYCASIGAGAVRTGDCVLSTGTAWVMVATADAPLFDDARAIHPCPHVLADRYGLLTSVPSGGESLNWYRDVFRPSETFESLGAEAMTAAPSAAAPLFIPKFTAAGDRAAFLRLDSSHTPADITRSVLEGVAFANRLHLETFARNGVPVERLIMIGGGASSTVWPRITADVSRIPIAIPERTEAACAGAAMLAGVGAGVFGDIEAAHEAFFRDGGSNIEPDCERSAIYEDLFAAFTSMLDRL